MVGIEREHYPPDQAKRTGQLIETCPGKMATRVHLLGD